MAREMTVARMLVLKAVKQYQDECRRSPSFRELLGLTDLKSTSTIAMHVKQLRKHSYLEEQYFGSPRSLVITDKGYKEIEAWSKWQS